MGIGAKALEKLARIKEQMRQEKQIRESVFADVGKYIYPDLQDWGDESPNKNGKAPDTGRDRYDTTAQDSSITAAKGLIAYSSSRRESWFALEAQERDIPMSSGAKDYFQLAERQMYRQLARSNFYDEEFNFIRCRQDMGIAVMFRLMNTEEGIPAYRTLHPKRIFVAEDRFRQISVLFRDFYLTAQDAVAWFGIDVMPNVIKTAFDNNSIEPFLFTEYIFPVGFYDVDLELSGKEYTSIYVADCDHTKAVAFGGYETKPFTASRYSMSLDGNVWGGDCPGILQLSNAKMLNSIMRDRIKLSQRIADPPVKATEGLYGRIRRGPGQTTYLESGQDYVAERITGDLSTLDQTIIDIRASIKSAYQSDLYLTLTQNIDKVKTATEAAGIQGEQAALIAVDAGRLAYEHLEPLLEDLFNLEIMSMRLPPPPQELGNVPVKIDFIGPLYQIQKRFVTMNKIQAFLQDIGPALQLSLNQSPVTDRFDWDGYLDVAAETHQVDKRILRSVVEAERIRRARAEAQAMLANQQMEMNNAKMQSDRAKSVQAVSEAEV